MQKDIKNDISKKKKNDEETQALKNKRNEEYQNDVIKDKLNNNRSIYTFNNRSK